MWGSLTGRVLTAESAVIEFIMGQPTFQSYDDLTGYVGSQSSTGMIKCYIPVS